MPKSSFADLGKRLTTWGIYPTRAPGIWCPLEPGSFLNTSTRPESNGVRPTIIFKIVVLPQPLGPSKPYLEKKDWNLILW